jgi:hypothetical protein
MDLEFGFAIGFVVFGRVDGFSIDHDLATHLFRYYLNHPLGIT